MGRPERPLDPAAGPVQAFAAELRKLRLEAGNPKYLQMQRLTGRSRTALAEAAGGDHLATWETVEAYVRACGADPAAWEARWEGVRDAVRPPRTEPGARQAGGSGDAGPRRPVRLLQLGLVVVALAAITAATATYLAHGSGAAAHAARRPPPGARGPRTIVVQNEVATGSAGLIEDSTPAYLSAKPIPFCSRQHCEITQTQMQTGAPLEATCAVQGAEMTNENTHSPGITHNRNGVFSALWYRCILSDGKAGYLSEVYVAPIYRGGLGLPTCPA